jgi:putative transcriptional regulator
LEKTQQAAAALSRPAGRGLAFLSAAAYVCGMQHQDSSGYLTGQFLIAMPQMRDPRFERTVVYMCAHSAEGAMGIVVNRGLDDMTFGDLLDQLEIAPPETADTIRIHFGGPVDSGRGFVLHSTDYMHESSMLVADGVALTATVDVLKAISEGTGPRRRLLALGYAGWGAGQLDDEIRDNAWLNVAADTDILFDEDLPHKWERAIHMLGFDFSALSADAGHA